MTPDEIIKAANDLRARKASEQKAQADEPLSPDEIISQAKALREQESKPSLLERGLTAFAGEAYNSTVGGIPLVGGMLQSNPQKPDARVTPRPQSVPFAPPQEAPPPPGFFDGMSQLTPGNLASGFMQGYEQMSGMMEQGHAALAALGPGGGDYEYLPDAPQQQSPVDRSQMGWFPKAAYDVVSNLAPSVAAPVMERGLPGAAIGMAGGAVIGAAGFGAPTAMLGAAPGAAGGAVIGGAAGLSSGTTVGAYEMAVGDVLQTMKQAGVDAGDAQMLALAYGIPYGAMEMLQLGVAGKYALGVLKKSIAGMAAKEITPEIAKNLVARAVKEGGKLAAGIASEIVAEGGQKGLTEGATAHALYNTGESERAADVAKGIPAAMLQEMEDVAPSMILTGGVGGSVSLAKGAARNLTPMDPLKVSREEWVEAGYDPLEHEKAYTEVMESGDRARIKNVSAATIRSYMTPEQPDAATETPPEPQTESPADEEAPEPPPAPPGPSGTRIPAPEEFDDPEGLTRTALDAAHPEGWTADDDTIEFLHASETTRESWIEQGGDPDAHRRQVLRAIELGVPVPDEVAAPYYTEDADFEAEPEAPTVSPPPGDVSPEAPPVEEELPGIAEAPAPAEPELEADNAPDPVEDVAVPDAAEEPGATPVVEEPPVGVPEDVGTGATEEQAATVAEPSGNTGELEPTAAPAAPAAPQSMVDEFQAVMDMGAHPPVYIPVKGLELSKEVKNFKKDADPETGEVEPLEGEFDDRGVAPIAVWRRTDGRLEVISGRHRLAHAKRNNRNSILSQVFNEADGFGADQAAALDAELNIRDGHGKVTDYGSYFRRAGLSKATARKRGLLRDTEARKGFTIGTMGSDDVFTSWENGAIETGPALAIVETAGADNAGQAIGLNLAISRPQLALDIPRFRETLKAILHMRVQGDSTMDMFGTETYDTAIEEAERRAAIAVRRQREIADKLTIIKAGRVDRGKAASLGIDINVNDEAAVEAERQRLRVEAERWRDWPQHPDLVQQVVAEEQGVGEVNPQVDMAPADVEVSDAEAAAETAVVPVEKPKKKMSKAKEHSARQATFAIVEIERLANGSDRQKNSTKTKRLADKWWSSLSTHLRKLGIEVPKRGAFFDINSDAALVAQVKGQIPEVELYQPKPPVATEPMPDDAKLSAEAPEPRPVNVKRDSTKIVDAAKKLGFSAKTHTAETGSTYITLDREDATVVVRVADHQEVYPPQPGERRLSVSPYDMSATEAISALSSPESIAEYDPTEDRQARSDASRAQMRAENESDWGRLRATLGSRGVWGDMKSAWRSADAQKRKSLIVEWSQRESVPWGTLYRALTGGAYPRENVARAIRGMLPAGTSRFSAESESMSAAAVADRDAVRASILTAVKNVARGLGMRVNIQVVRVSDAKTGETRTDVDAYYKDGTVFLNYEGIIANSRRFGVSPEAYVVGKLIHEGIIHHGFSFLSEKSRKHLAAWVEANVGADEFNRVIPDVDAYRNLSPEARVEEYIARIAERARTGGALTEMQGGVWRRVVAAFRKAFRVKLNTDLAAIARTPAEVNKLVASLILDGGNMGSGASRSTLRLSVESEFKKVRFVSVGRMARMMGDRPEYLDHVVDRMSYAHARLMNGEMTTPDVIRAYVITTASIQAGSMNRDLLEEKTGFRVDDEFCEESPSGEVTVRPEDAIAAWLMTERGERAVANAARGRVDMKDWENGLFIRRAFGNASVMERMFASNLGGSRITMSNINELTTRLNDARTDPKKFHEALRDLHGVSFGKAPFIAHLLGLGTEPTVDAVEVNAWLTGKGSVNGASERLRSQAAFLKRAGVMSGSTHKAITKRVKQLGEIMGQDIDPEIRATLIHHWLWDAVRGTETRHTALYLAMDGMRFSAEADVGNEPHLNAMPRVAEDATPEAHDKWLVELEEWLEGAPATMAFVDPDDGKSLILVSREARQAGKWRQTFWHKVGDGWEPHGHVTFDTRLDAVRDVSVYGVDYDPHILFSAEEPERASDREYMAAVERGDMETAQRLVDEAASSAGYTTKAYHGSPEEDIEEFNGSHTSYGIFFTPDPNTAEYYKPKEDSGKIYDVYLRISNPVDLDDPDDFHKVAKEAIWDEDVERENSEDKKLVSDFLEYLLETYHEDSDIRSFFESNKWLEWESEIGDGYTRRDAIEGFSDDLYFGDIEELVEKVSDRFPEIKHWFNDEFPLVSSELNRAEEAYGSQEFYMQYQDDFLQAAENMGYDGVYFSDPSSTGESVSIVVFGPRQIKSAEPVVKDADGNVIPLSKRFDAASPDIRYSAEIPAPDPVSDALDIYGTEIDAANALIRQVNVQLKAKQVPRRETMATIYTLVTRIPKEAPGRDKSLSEFWRVKNAVQVLEAQYRAEANAEQTILYEVDPSAQQGFLFSIEDTSNGRPDHGMASPELVELMEAIIGEGNATVARYMRPEVLGMYSPDKKRITIRSDMFAGDTLTMLLLRNAPTEEQQAKLREKWGSIVGVSADEIIIHYVRRPKGYVVRVIRRNHNKALYVMAHEIGHAEDERPGPDDDGPTMGRGRILGRIAKLRHFMGRFLGVVSADERRTLRRQAQRDAKAAGFDPKQDRDAYNQAVSDLYQNALAARLQETGTYNEMTVGDIPGIRAELEALTQWWRGVTPDQMNDYLKSGEELYADMISVLLNQPEEFEARCPQTYRALGEFFAEHQEMQDTYTEIQKDIHAAHEGNPEALLDRRLERLRRMMVRDEDIRRKVIDDRNAEMPRMSWRWFWQDIVRIIQARDVVLPDAESRMAHHDIAYAATHLEQYHRDIQAQVVKVLDDAGVNLENYGLFLGLRRVAYDEGRQDIANFQGTTDDSAQALLDRMRVTMGNRAFTAMETAAENMADIRERHIFPALEASGLVDAEFLAKLRANRYYSTFEVAKYFAKFSGGNGTKILYKQFGSVNDIMNPFYSTMATDAQIVWAALNNRSKMKTVEGLRREAPGDIYEAKWTFKGGERVPENDKNPRLYGLLEWREGKERKAAIVPLAIAKLYEHNPTVAGPIMSAFLTATSVLKRMMTTNNPRFGISNFIRDFERTYRNIPANGFWEELLVGPSLALNVLRSLPDAFQDAYLKQSTPIVREMYEKGLLIAGRTWSARNETGIEQYERTQREWNLALTKHENLLVKAIKWVFEDFNQMLERVNKIAGYRQTRGMGLSEMDEKRLIRADISSPDFAQGGAITPATNVISLFSNAAIQELNSLAHVARTRPITLGIRITISVIVPKMIMAYFAHGEDEDDDDEATKELRRRYKMIPERDNMHRINFPVMGTESGYISLPVDQSMDFIGSIVWAAMASEDPNRWGAARKAAVGLIPGMDSLNSFLDVARVMVGAAQGINEYDYFRGVPVVDQTTWEAGGLPVAAEVGKWAYNEVIGSKVGIEFERPYSVRQSKASSVPVLGAFLRSFYRDSDFGIQEQEMFKEQAAERDAARARMPMKKFIADTVRDMETRDDMSPSEIWRAAKDAGAVPEGYKYSQFRGMLTSTLNRRFGEK